MYYELNLRRFTCLCVEFSSHCKPISFVLTNIDLPKLVNFYQSLFLQGDLRHVLNINTWLKYFHLNKLLIRTRWLGETSRRSAVFENIRNLFSLYENIQKIIQNKHHVARKYLYSKYMKLKCIVITCRELRRLLKMLWHPASEHAVGCVCVRHGTYILLLPLMGD